MAIVDILNEFNENNSTKYKQGVMAKYSNNKLLIRVFQLTYDKVKYTFSITLKNAAYIAGSSPEELSLDAALDILVSMFVSKKWTGNKALHGLEDIMNRLSPQDAYVMERIVDRDLRINFTKTGFNKVVNESDRIKAHPYMRCSVYDSKTARNITFPAICQLKADGLACSILVYEQNVTFTTRNGEDIQLPHLETVCMRLPNGVYIGELLVRDITVRSVANGLINSTKDKNKVYVQLWDFVPIDEFRRAKDKHNKTPYTIRWTRLLDILDTLRATDIQAIQSLYVNNINEALEQTSQWMNANYEGSILKDQQNIFIDGTSTTMLKLKVKFSVDVRITGFVEGTPGTKREHTFGSIMYESDDKHIQGQCSGFNDATLIDFNSRRTELIGQIMEIEGNDLTKARDHNYYAVSHPRFVELRTDKTLTDTLQRALQSIKSAKMLS